MNQTKTDLHPCPGKSIGGIRNYIRNMAKSPLTPLCIVHCGVQDVTSRDRKSVQDIVADFDELIRTAKEHGVIVFEL